MSYVVISAAKLKKLSLASINKIDEKRSQDAKLVVAAKLQRLNDRWYRRITGIRKLLRLEPWTEEKALELLGKDFSDLWYVRNVRYQKDLDIAKNLLWSARFGELVWVDTKDLMRLW